MIFGVYSCFYTYIILIAMKVGLDFEARQPAQVLCFFPQ